MIRLGLIGFGLAGDTLHAGTIAAVPAIRIAAVVTSRVDAVKARLPDAAVVSSPEALFADPSIDAVVIATPNAQHAPLARAALDAGKHVVVDKPFVTRPEDGAALIRLARAKGRVLTVFFNRRWDADFLTVQRVVREGRLGDIRLAEFAWDRFRPGPRDGWKEDPAFEGGLLADLGSHMIDQALQLFGTPEAIAADLAVQRASARQDDYIDLTLHYGSTRVKVLGSTLIAAARPRFALHGSAASFVKHGIDPQEAQLKAGDIATNPGFGEETAPAWGVLTDANGVTAAQRSEKGRWANFYEGFADAIEAGLQPPVDPVDALVGIRLMALARQSAAEGRLVAVDREALGLA